MYGVWCMPGGVPGWVYRVGTGVYYPATLLEGGLRYSEAGPVGPCRGPEWVVSETGTPAAPGPPTPHPWCSGARFAVQACSPGK